MARRRLGGAAAVERCSGGGGGLLVVPWWCGRVDEGRATIGPGGQIFCRRFYVYFTCLNLNLNFDFDTFLSEVLFSRKI